MKRLSISNGMFSQHQKNLICHTVTAFPINATTTLEPAPSNSFIDRRLQFRNLRLAILATHQFDDQSFIQERQVDSSIHLSRTKDDRP